MAEGKDIKTRIEDMIDLLQEKLNELNASVGDINDKTKLGNTALITQGNDNEYRVYAPKDLNVAIKSFLKEGTLAQLNTGTDTDKKMYAPKTLEEWMVSKAGTDINYIGIPGQYKFSVESSTNGDAASKIVKRTSQASINAAGGFFETSDVRLKSEIEDYNPDFEDLLKIQLKKYNKKVGGNKKVSEVGVVAQEIKEVFPNVVSEDKDGILSVNYPKLALLALSGLKELKKEIDELKRQNNGLAEKYTRQ